MHAPVLTAVLSLTAPAADVPEEPVVVPMKMINGRPVVEAIVNGDGPFAFVFDTGSDGAFFHRDFARELQLEVTGSSIVGAPGGPATIAVDEHTIDSIAIGAATFEDLGALSHEDAMLRDGLGETKGVIGLSTFADCLVTLDFPGERLVIQRGALSEDEGTLGYRIDEYGLPAIAIEVDGNEIESHLDTGNPGGFMLPAKYESELTLESPPIVVGRGRTASGEFEVRHATLDGAAIIAGHRIEDVDLTFNDMFGHGNVGSEILSMFAITIDQRNERIRFERPPGAKPVVPRRPSYGIILAMTPEGPIGVRGTVPGGVAESAGIEAGDQIVAINGTPIDELDMAARGEAFRVSPIRLTIDRDGKTVEVEMAHPTEG